MKTAICLLACLLPFLPMDQSRNEDRALVKKQLPDQVLALKGIPAIKVVIEEIPVKPQLSSRLKTQVELRLRREGIQIDNAARPCLYLNLNMMALSDDLHYVYGAGLSLIDDVSLLRDLAILVTANTWEKGWLGIRHKDIMEATLKSEVDNHLDAFLNDYLTANPRKPLTTQTTQTKKP